MDNLRGFAVSTVIIYHFFELLGLQSSAYYYFVSPIGQLGVPLFFVISGYLIYRSVEYSITHEGTKDGLKHYTYNRLFRILPAYYFNLIIVLALSSTIVSSEYFYSSGFLDQVLSHLTFSSFFIHRDSGLGVNGAYWTLSIEMLWYIVAPLLFLFVKKDRYYLLLIVIAFLYLWSIDIGIIDTLYGLNKSMPNYLANLYYFSFQLPAQIIYFIAGIFIYKYLRYINIVENMIAKSILFILLTSIFVFIAHQQFFLVSFLMQNIVKLIAITLIFILFYKNNIPYSSLLSWIGKISYSLYLWHMPVLFVMKESNILSHASLLNTVLIFLIFLFGISSMSYYFVEQGGFSLRKKFNPLNRT